VGASRAAAPVDALTRAPPELSRDHTLELITERGPRPLREVALESFFFRRLHHWQATREVVVLRESATSIGTPDYIGFSWATCRDVAAIIESPLALAT